MEEYKNYFAVNRKLIQSPLWLSEKFTRGQAWVDLIGLAQWQPSYIMIRGNRVDIERGQLGYSQLTLSSRWGWSRNKTRAFLKSLEIEHRIEQQNYAVTTVITIVNYDNYQKKVQQNEQQKVQQKDNRLNNRKYTYNKDNKDNKENNTNVLQKTEYGNPEINKIIETIKTAFNLPALDGTDKNNRYAANRILKKYKDIELIEATCNVAANDSFWHNKITSVNDLEKHFMKLASLSKENNNTLTI